MHESNAGETKMRQCPLIKKQKDVDPDREIRKVPSKASRM
jgi:hypothetical protein